MITLSSKTSSRSTLNILNRIFNKIILLTLSLGYFFLLLLVNPPMSDHLNCQDFRVLLQTGKVSLTESNDILVLRKYSLDLGGFIYSVYIYRPQTYT